MKTLYVMSKEGIFRKIVELHEKREAYFNTIPPDLREFVYDNQYANLLCMENDVLLEQVFGEHFEDVMWFLYEWKAGYTVGVDGTETVINSLDEFITWLKANSGF